jgi:hypothetical protein
VAARPSAVASTVAWEGSRETAAVAASVVAGYEVGETGSGSPVMAAAEGVVGEGGLGLD